MLLGIDPFIWKHVSYWFGIGVEKINTSISEASIYEFGAAAVIVVVLGFIFLRTHRFN